MNPVYAGCDQGLLQRVYSEFLEMPGLRLTCPQAQRLWAVDERTCREVLEALVEARFLCRQGHGLYARISDGNARPHARSGQIRVRARPGA